MEPASASSADLYLNLLKRCLTRTLFLDGAWDFDLAQTRPFDPAVRADGRDWPTEAETMVGLRRLDNLQDSIVAVLRDGVAGDLVETGVWRGGCGILMRAVLKAFGDRDRSVWLADSFQGLPPPAPEEYPQDAGDAQKIQYQPACQHRRKFVAHPQGLRAGDTCLGGGLSLTQSRDVLTAS